MKRHKLKTKETERGYSSFTMQSNSKVVSKIYRRLVTSNEAKAYMIFEKLDDELKFKVRKKLDQNGSKQAIDLLKKLQ
jgi:hypothetical protein